MTEPDDLVPREATAKAIEALADNPELSSDYPPGSDAETAYTHAADDAATTVREYPDDEASDE